jgi:hypothetical protein
LETRKREILSQYFNEKHFEIRKKARMRHSKFSIHWWRRETSMRPLKATCLKMVAREIALCKVVNRRQSLDLESFWKILWLFAIYCLICCNSSLICEWKEGNLLHLPGLCLLHILFTKLIFSGNTSFKKGRTRGRARSGLTPSPERNQPVLNPEDVERDRAISLEISTSYATDLLCSIFL